MTHRAVQIRAWLQTQKRPCTIEAITAARAVDPDVVVGAAPAEIAAGLGIPEGPDGLRERMRLYWSLAQMHTDGICGREGIGRGLRYFVLRVPVRPKITAEEKRLRHNARARARYVPKMRDLTRMRALRAQKAAERKAERDQRRAAIKAERQARREAERAARRKRKPAKVAKPVREKAPVRCAPRPVPKPVLQRMESVEEFKARGGKVDQLPAPWERAA